jgi:ABC-type multidrug transport system ATPase subunit
LIVMGRNGVGKSTLLKIVAGLIPPTEGKVVLPEGDFRREVGFCGLDQSVYPHLTVREHLKLAGELRGCDDRADELLELVELAYAHDSFAGKMSTGMRARLKLAMAVQARPKLLMLDEPGAGLDEAGQSIVERICVEQRERGVLVIATNDVEERRLGNLELELSR